MVRSGHCLSLLRTICFTKSYRPESTPGFFCSPGNQNIARNSKRNRNKFLGFPRVDPHGDPIPTEEGVINQPAQVSAADLRVNDTGVGSGVKDTQPLFLQHLDKVGIYLGASVKVINKVEYDKSLDISVENQKIISVSFAVARNILITR